MSQASIPNITPIISITPAQSVALMLSSIALEELALAHIVNAEAEKLQFVLGTLPGSNLPATVTISNLIDINNQVLRTFQTTIKEEMLLQFKLENVIDLWNTIQFGAAMAATPTAVPISTTYTTTTPLKS